jgi:hypothetical protein
MRFGQLVAINRVSVVHHGWLWLCECDCGKQTTVLLSYLTAGETTSCGCNRIKALVSRSKTHGMSGTPEYIAYTNAMARCNPRHPRYADYGGRGIEFRFKSFEQFFADVGPRPSYRHTIDRKNNDGHYEPGNIHWATQSEQSSNQRHRRAMRQETKEKLRETSRAARAAKHWSTNKKAS